MPYKNRRAWRYKPLSTGIAQMTNMYRAILPMAKSTTVSSGFSFKYPAAAQSGSPMIGTHDNSRAKLPQRCKRRRAVWCSLRNVLLGKRQARKRPSQYVVKPPSVLPAVAASSNRLREVVELATRYASNISELPGNSVAERNAELNNPHKLMVSSDIAVNGLKQNYNSNP